MERKFHYGTLEEMVREAEELNVRLPLSDHPDTVLGSPIRLGGETVGNRFVAQPIEGFDSEADGAPSERSIERYCRLVRGGFRMLWLESVSVDEQGRSNPLQLWIRPENVERFAEMVRRIRSQTGDKVYIVIQLTHSGRNSNPGGNPRSVCAFSNPCIPRDNEYILPDGQIPEIEEDYVTACRLAKQAGFDAVDIRTCHGYLLNEFLSAYNRPGRYGGSFENRIRFLLETVDKVRSSVDIPVGVRLNMYDGLPYPYGWGADPENPLKENPEEPLRLVKLLYDRGIRLLNITSGIGAYSPFVIRPYDRGGKEPTEHPLVGENRMLTLAKRVKELAPEAVVIASAFTWMREYGPVVGAGGIEQGWFDMAGFGRQSIAYPEMVRDVLEKGGLCREKCCITCCGCTNLIKKSGKMLRCIIKDRE